MAYAKKLFTQSNKNISEHVGKYNISRNSTVTLHVDKSVSLQVLKNL